MGSGRTGVAPGAGVATVGRFLALTVAGTVPTAGVYIASSETAREAWTPAGETPTR